MSFSNTALADRRQARSAADHYHRRRRRRAGSSKRFDSVGGGPLQSTLAEVADVGYLLRSYHHARREGGQSPGLDGVTYDELGRGEAAAILRDVSSRILAGAYRPQPAREVPIPKPLGGFRPLRVGSVIDRAVDTALLHKLTPLLDPLFLNNSHGFRPGRSAWGLLAQLEVASERSGRQILVNDDVAKAFDSVVIDVAMDYFGRHVNDQGLLGLIGVVLSGHEGRAVGIAQGSAVSPLALNLLLHHGYDVPLDDGQCSPCRARYADNLLYLATDEYEAYRSRERSRELLAPLGLALKDCAVVDLLHGGRADVLGYVVSLGADAQWRYEIAPGAWDSLAEGLQDAHGTDDPPQTARAVVRGWLNWLGPTYTTRQAARATVQRVLDAAAKSGFREVPSPRALTALMERSHQRWETELDRARGSQPNFWEQLRLSQGLPRLPCVEYDDYSGPWCWGQVPWSSQPT